MATAPSLHLSIEVAGRRIGLPAADVREVVAHRRLTPVPQAPPSLLGLANLRGVALPVLSLAALLDERAGPTRRIVVMEGANPVGLAVDAVLGLDMGEASVEPLDVAALVAQQFAALAARSGRRGERVAARRSRSEAMAETPVLTIVVAGQSYGMPLTSIEAVIPVGDVTELPEPEAAAVGTMAWRGAVLPLLALDVLLGKGQDRQEAGRRVVVVRVAGHSVGLLVDAIGVVLAIDTASIDPVPPVLARGGGEARITGIARLDGGRRLLSLLASDNLLDPAFVAGLGTVRDNDREDAVRAEAATETLLVFTLDEADYALPLSAISEVARLPEKLTPLPRAPGFVRGVMSLRGRPLAVIDQAARFGSASSGGRLLVARSGPLEAAFLVDRIVGVVRVATNALVEAPPVGGDPQLFETVLPGPGDGPMTLLISPFALLAQTERDLLAGVVSAEMRARP